MVKTNAIFKNNEIGTNGKATAKNHKWNNYLKKTWDKIKSEIHKQSKRSKESKKSKESNEPKESKRKKLQEYPIIAEGLGLVVLSGDPNALLERLDLLLASKEAGHTGVRNELVGICDELKRMGFINNETYKKLNSVIKK